MLEAGEDKAEGLIRSVGDIHAAPGFFIPNRNHYGKKKDTFFACIKRLTPWNCLAVFIEPSQDHEGPDRPPLSTVDGMLNTSSADLP